MRKRVIILLLCFSNFAFLFSENGGVLLNKKNLTIDYNVELFQANWILYRISSYTISGEEKRRSSFSKDMELDSLFEGKALVTKDYANSGYDRGHLCAAADMKYNPISMKESFLMSNVAPQTTELNRGKWKSLEERIRSSLGIIDTAYYIITGGILDSFIDTINTETGKDIPVPKDFFKVVIDYIPPYQSLATYIMPNIGAVDSVENYLVTLDSLSKRVDLNRAVENIPKEDREEVLYLFMEKSKSVEKEYWQELGEKN